MTYLRPTGVAVINADDPRVAPASAPRAHRSVLGRQDVGGGASTRHSVTAHAAARGTSQFGAAHRYPVRLPLDRRLQRRQCAWRGGRRVGARALVRSRSRSACPTSPRCRGGSRSCTSTRPCCAITRTHRMRWSGALGAVGPFARGPADRGVRRWRRPGPRQTPADGRDRRSLWRTSLILTSDNPRTEDPERILDDIEQGMTGPHERIEDREQAVLRAIELAGPDDLVLFAGKGHETYQVRGTTALSLRRAEIVRGASRRPVSDEPLRPAGTPGFWTLDRVAGALLDGAACRRSWGSGVPRRGWRQEVARARIARSARSRRTAAPWRAGDLFVALSGDRFDGHDFLGCRCRARRGRRRRHSPGARRRDSACPSSPLPIRSTRLGALARFRRRAWGKPVIAIAGSNGKTRRRSCCAARSALVFSDVTPHRQLQQPDRRTADVARPSPTRADIAVVEIGTNAHGRVAPLRAIAEPDIAVVTSIGEEHLEGFGISRVYWPRKPRCSLASAGGRAGRRRGTGRGGPGSRATQCRHGGLGVKAICARRAGSVDARRAGRARRRRRARSRSRSPACITCGTPCWRSPSREPAGLTSPTRRSGSRRGVAAPDALGLDASWDERR